MELNKSKVHKSHNLLHVTSPLKMGLHQIFWSHHSGFVTLLQTTLHAQPIALVHDLQHTLPASAVPIRNYLSILTQLCTGTALHVELP